MSFGREREKLLDTGLNGVKTASKVLVYKVSLFLGNKVADAVTTYDDNKIEQQEPVEQIFVPPEMKH